MSLGTFIETTIKKNTQGDIVDIFGFATALRFNVYKDRAFGDPMKIGIMGPSSEDDNLADIWLNPNNNHQQDRTVLALLMARCLLYLESNSLVRNTYYDTFFMSDMPQYRMTPHLMLATRLAIPVNTIERIQDLHFDKAAYANKAQLLPSFINSAVHVSSDSFFGMMRELDFVFSSRMYSAKM
jgi:hypothetical protein